MKRGRVDVVVGVQWGDEGKGRVVDAMAGGYDIVARFAGGDNAGHTLIVGDRKIALRIVPSGVLNPEPRLFIGGGAVVSMETLADEIDTLRQLGVDTGRIAISDRAQIVLPQHGLLDRAAEEARGSLAIGTTGRGIGPAYADRAARSGVRFADLRTPRVLEARVRANLASHLRALDEAEIDIEGIVDRTLMLGERLAPAVVDGVAYLHEALERGASVLAEGAQGTLLDVGYGSYPYVTSSHTLAGAACAGLGIGASYIDRVIGIAKAYCTRVGAGPFPSELHGENADRLRAAGGEFGTVTGRPRRCGWFDAVIARYASRVNGLTGLFITKLDVLGGFDPLGIVTGYAHAGREAGFGAFDEVDVQTEFVDGWAEDIAGVRRIADLPANAQRYVDRITGAFAVPLIAVSVGPERSALATPA
jgi:adenylosuccinate synthase